MSSEKLEIPELSKGLDYTFSEMPIEKLWKFFDQKIEIDFKDSFNTDSFNTGSLDMGNYIIRSRSIKDVLYREIPFSQTPKFIGATETWDDIKNYYARILNIDENKVVVDCLIDEIEKDFQKRIFNRHLFEDLGSLEVGAYVLIKIFLKKGKSMITVRDAEKLVKKSLFEDYSEFDDLNEIQTKESTLTNL